MGVFEDGDEAGGEGSEGAAGPAVIVIELWWYSASLAPQEVNIINFIFLMKLNRTLACTQISDNQTGNDYTRQGTWNSSTGYNSIGVVTDRRWLGDQFS